MTITAAIVLFAMIWFMVFYITLQLRVTTQGDEGKVVPGTPRGAPAGFVVKRKAKIATLVSIVLWAAIAGIIISGKITMRDLDYFERMGPPTAANP